MSDRSNSTAAGTPADTPSTSWEDAPAFRELFLVHFPEEAAEAFRLAGRYLYDSALCAGLQEVEPFIAARVRALLADLRFTAQVLASLGQVREQASLSAAEDELAGRCSVWAGEVLAVALNIQGALDEDEEDGEPGS